KGDAILWGQTLGASIKDLDAYQGHAGLAYGHGVPINWPTIMEGGFQVNVNGQRFSNEAKGYSEQAVKVVAQPGKVAFPVFDQRIYDIMTQFDDFMQAVEAGTIHKTDTVEELTAKMKVPVDMLQKSVNDA